MSDVVGKYDGFGQPKHDPESIIAALKAQVASLQAQLVQNANAATPTVPTGTPPNASTISGN